MASRTVRAGLVFPVGRVHRHLRKGQYASHIGSLAPVSCAAALEYLVAELIEMAGNFCIANKKKRIIPRHLMLAIRQDAEFNQLLSDVIISEGGVQPHIEAVLLPKSSSEKRAKG
jgi:histone H2A